MGASKTLKQAQANQQNIGNQQLSLATQQTANANNNFGQGTTLNKPVIDYATALASGDPTRMLQAAAPQLSTISRQAASARGAIQDQLPVGGTRNFALASLSRDQYGKSADTLNSAYLSAFPALQGLASNANQLGLNQLGAGFGGLQAAGNTNAQVAQTEQARQQAKLQSIGSLAGMAGGALTGGLSSGLSGGSIGQGMLPALGALPSFGSSYPLGQAPPVNYAPGSSAYGNLFGGSQILR